MIVCVFWLVNKCVFMALWSAIMTWEIWLQIVRIYSFMKEIKMYIRPLYIVFLFVESENNFIKAKKQNIYLDFIALWSAIPSDSLSNSPAFGFHHAIKARKTCFFKCLKLFHKKLVLYTIQGKSKDAIGNRR